MCQRSRTGGYIKIHCGEDASPLLLRPPSIVSPKPYTDPLCSMAVPNSRTAQLGVCTASFTGRQNAIDHNYILSVAQPSSPLVVTVTKYAKSDLKCARQIVGIQRKSYVSVPNAASATGALLCLPDPLHPQLYYSLRAGGAPFNQAAQTAPSAPTLQGYIVTQRGPCSGTTPPTVVSEVNIYRAGVCVGYQVYFGNGGMTSGFMMAALSVDKTTFSLNIYSDSACKNFVGTVGIYVGMALGACTGGANYAAFYSALPAVSAMLNGADTSSTVLSS